MAITDENINAALQAYANPLSIQVNALTKLQDSVLEGKEVSDGNNVFTFLLEFMATMTAGAAGEAVNAFSGLYPSKAMTSADLYKHMSDFDYVNLYSTPASTKITLMFDRNFLINNAVQDPNNKMYHKIVVPSQSTFTIGSIVFGIHYPIEIIVKKNIMPNGKVDYDSTTFTVLWDTSRHNPLYTLRTNILEHRFYKSGGVSLLCIEVPIHQFTTKVYNETVSSAAGFIKRYPYTDKFYAIRVFHNQGGDWSELHQTLSDTIYDTTRPTVKVKVLTDTNIVEIAIPQVYISTGMIGSKVMARLYTCRGVMNMDISNYSMDQFSASFLVNDETVDTGFSDMLKYIRTLQIAPTVSTISGGRDGLSFSELRNRVINDSTYDVLITPRDLVAYFEDHGYSISRYLDNITDRIYLAHKVMTDAKSNMIGAGDYNTIFTDDILTPVIDMDTSEKYIDKYSGIKYITDNSVMILPTNIYKYDESKNSMMVLDDEDVAELNKLNKTDRVKNFNSELYSFSPFHTKLTTSPTPNCVNYDLLNPSMSNMVFESENPNLPTQVSVYSYGITHLKDGSGGYDILINLYMTDDISGVPLTEYLDNTIVDNFLMVLTSNDSDGMPCHVIGEYIGTSDDSGLPIYKFKLSTDYKMSDSDNLHITNMRAGDKVISTYLGLTSQFKIMSFIRSTLLNDPVGSMKGVNNSKFPNETKGYTWLATQVIDVTLGSKIDMLHSNISLTLGNIKTQLHPTTEFATYSRPVYARYTKEEVGSEVDKIGLLKYPLEEVHSPGELILSAINGEFNPPACKLHKVQPPDVIELSKAEYYSEINGLYYLEDNSSTGIYRKWKKMLNASRGIYIMIENHMGDEMEDTRSDQWKINKYNPLTGITTLYHTNLTTALATPPLKSWILTSSSSKAIVETHLVSDPVVKEYNMALSLPHTATSWSGNIWTRDSGDMYLYGCGDIRVNGRYNLINSEDPADRVWEKVVEIEGDEMIHRIHYSADDHKWHISDFTDTLEPESLFSCIDTDPSTEPWFDNWTDASGMGWSPPMFYELNHDDVEHKVVVEDILKFVHATLLDESLQVGSLEDTYKTISHDTYEILDPIKGIVLFVSGDMPGVYIRDQELSDFDPTNYLSSVQLFDFFRRYDSPEYVNLNEEELANRYDIPRHIVKKIIAWRSPWRLLIPMDDMDQLEAYLNEANINGHSLERIIEIQNKTQYPVKTFKNSGDFASYTGTLTHDQMVYLDDISGVFTPSDIPMLGDSYLGGPAGGLCVVSDVNTKKLTLVCNERSFELAKSKVNSYGTRHGLMYCIYERLNSEHFTLRYISPLTYNEQGIDVSLASSAWHLSDKWPWDVTNWVDATTGASNKDIKFVLDDITTSALIRNRSGEVMVNDDGSVNEDPSSRSVTYNTSMLHVDYKPILSSELQHKDYRNKILDNIRQHFIVLSNARSSLLEQTSLYFKPIRTIGVGKFKYTTDEYVSMRLDMTMDIRLHVEQRVIVSAHLREMIERNIYSIIARHLTLGPISQTNITRDILDELGDSIIYVDVLGINDMTDMQTLIPENKSFSPYVKQNLYVKDDGSIGTKSGLNIRWVVVE